MHKAKENWIKAACCGLFSLAFAQSTFAQSIEKKIFMYGRFQVLDTLPIAMESIILVRGSDTLRYGRDYTWLPSMHGISLNSPSIGDSAWVRYSLLPDWIEKPWYRRLPIKYGSALPTGDDGNLVGENSEDEVITNGVLTRGLSFGNSQDVVLNSNLNLRMAGQVAPGIGVEAAITDQEYPFQPDGSTSTLQDFDRIYIKFILPKSFLLMGDYPFNSSSRGRFIKYAKKNRGLQFEGTDSIRNTRMQYSLGGALARGRFARNEIQGIEGLQGPYRLEGARNEQFVIVISGTEAVYLDGQRMERGLQADYTIDYNLGEIIFTPRRIISVFSRIVVEFQYSDRFYTRSILGGYLNADHGKWSLYAAAYNEQDAKNAPIQQSLDFFDSSKMLSGRDILRMAGDDPSLAATSGARLNTEFSPSQPNYLLIDTGALAYYQYASLPDSGKKYYTLSFSYVGPGKGDYEPGSSGANGKIYTFLPRVGGQPQGTYAPVLVLNPPNRTRMLEGGFGFRPRKQTSIRGNAAFSALDRNLFSSYGDSDNAGYGVSLDLSDRSRIFKAHDSLKHVFMINETHLEQTSKNFGSVERFREVEFGRQWNRSLDNPENGTDPGDSRYITHKSQIIFGQHFIFNGNFGLLDRKGILSDYYEVNGRYTQKGWFVQPGMLNNHSNNGLNNFNRQSLSTGTIKKSGSLVLTGTKELSQFENTNSELLAQSYAFEQLELAIKKQWRTWTLGFNGQARSTQNLKDSALSNSNRSLQSSTELARKGKQGSVLKMGFSQRRSELLDSFFAGRFKTEAHFAGRLEYNFAKLWKRFSGNLFYQTLSAREQQRQFAYFEVPAGQGVYTWVDYNGNKVQEINEFEETAFKDQARYVRLLVPTGNYIKAQTTEFNGNLIYNNLGAEMKHYRLQNRLTWNYNGRSTEPGVYEKLFPFAGDPGNVNLLAYNAFVRDMLEYEAASGKYLIQYNTQLRGNKFFFSNGFDARQSLGHTVFGRLNIGEVWQLKTSLERRNSRYNSQYLPANDFNYTRNSLEPVLVFQPGNRLRIGASAKFLKDRSSWGADLSTQTDLGLQITKSVGKGGIIDVKGNILNAEFKGVKNTPLAYDILQGFSPGRNLRFTADLRFNAAKNIQVLMGYEGRKTADAKFVHIGRAEARYLF